ncbi:MAG: o-succinylbenzoate synthase [Clostridia bacterium]|nr:o-succinylbenzoate synthase [Clostridia bacterium]
MIDLKRIILRQIRMKLKAPFTTSWGSIQERDLVIVEIHNNEGLIGWGEGVAFSAPWYTEETIKTTWHMLEDFLIPILLKNKISHPQEVSCLFSKIRKNNMAKAAIEGAVWDLYAKSKKITLAEAIGGNKQKIEVGVAIGIKPVEQLLKQISFFIEQGYKRIKIKIKPGLERRFLEPIRENFPKIPLMVDANSAYTLKDINLLKVFDKYNLMMIEQPLAPDDIIDHAKLQKELQTPICLDESINSYEDARKAIELGSCKIINIKIGRVGGILEAKRIHDLCSEKGIPVWCGGMLESGIGRAHNIALTTLNNFILPGDTSGSCRYWEKDIIEPEVIVKNGVIEVPEKYGLGFNVNIHELEKVTIHKKVFENKI